MGAPVRPRTLADLQDLIGTPLGPTSWTEVTQEAIDTFAEVTGDSQWIHVDPARAADGPFGTTVAHGLYTLSLLPVLSTRLMRFDGFAHSLNYGYDRIRFPAPVPVGSRLRMTLTVAAAERATHGGIQIRTSQTVECDAAGKPVLVAESIALVFEASA
ncbi:MaoC family dehydratase [Planotetraspora kaengkrachanensis]|uniref:MaoC family dehydratase n=1 Tax=Planotetraspora kaengkrachanensis TaxID=575193 RepID=A0A8J3PS67_9ACTN|nr:MaoC family dehydratase [Planotetraspora kaengkrachanensis]GIG78663.1 MaoC family dehydratase [Planotetraspora kaengkrachanensis]